MKAVFTRFLALLLFICFFMNMNFYTVAYAANPNTAMEKQSQIKKKNNKESIEKQRIHKDGLTKAQKKLGTQLLQLVRPDIIPQGRTKEQIIADLHRQGIVAMKPNKEAYKDVLANVYIQLFSNSNVKNLDPYVHRVNNYDKSSNLAAAEVDIDNLETIAALDCVKSIQLVLPPVIRKGAVTSQGDSVLRAELARTEGAVDGSGIQIGIISDGVDNASAAIASGDLPGNLTILGNSVGGDEGTAMLEIVHDLAPGAQLYFHDSGNNLLAFNEAIDELIAAGCDIICDDVGWIAEPFYEDGVVARHVKQRLLENQILYVSAAGNAAQSHYQGRFNDDGFKFHDFRQDESTGPDLYATIPSGASILVVLQWNEPSGDAHSDFDLFMTDLAYQTLYASSEYEQSGDEDPIEVIEFTNTGSDTINAAILVYSYGGIYLKDIELYIFDDGCSISQDNLVASDSIFGHPAVSGVVACGAVGASSPDQAESYSSQGPVTMLTETRQKPDLCGVDGVSVTGAGGFPSTFYGTSASAPHVAAIAALVWSKYPDETPAQVKAQLFDSAIDLGSAGDDAVFGNGRIDALDAVNCAFHTVTFDSQGGTAVGSVIASHNCPIARPANPTRIQYQSFGGWYKDAECTDDWDFNTDVVTMDLTLFAKWIESRFTVRFDSCGGTPVPDVLVPLFSTMSEPIAPTKTGYNFAGWYNASDIRWNFLQDQVTKSMTLYAKWFEKYYYVSFNTMGGNEIPDISVLFNKAIGTTASNPIRTGYTFLGWYREASCIHRWILASDLVTGPMTLYAKWRINTYTVSFNSSGGSAVSSISAIYNTTIAEPAPPTRTGYTFSGWYKESGFITPWVFSTEVITSNITLYAKWMINSYTVSFDTQGGSAVASKTANHNALVSVPSSPTRSGFVFGGWYKEAACVNIWNFSSDRVTADIMLFAKWNVTVFFNSQGGSSVASVTVSPNATLAEPSPPIRDGFSFAGWYRESACINRWNFDTDIVTARTTLYAKWVSNTCAVVFDSLGGTVISSITVQTGGKVTAPVPPTRSGYSFQGWYKELACTTAWDFDNDIVTEDITLYAKWVSTTPTGVKAASASYSSAVISWTAVPGADGYQVYRATSSTGTYALVSTVTGTSFTNAGLATGTTYYYKVRSYAGATKVYSAFSPVVSAKPVPAAPTSPKATPATYNSIKVTWAAVSGATKYEVYRATYSTGTYALLTTTSYPYYTNTSIGTGIPYYYKVRAYRLVGSTKVYGPYSAKDIYRRTGHDQGCAGKFQQHQGELEHGSGGDAI